MLIVDRTEFLPWHPTRTWEHRSMDDIDRIVVHQELGMGSVAAVNRYHITPGRNNHLSKRGAPHFAYHFGIERSGEVVQANRLDQITWHTRSQNSSGIGIMLVGDFSGPDHEGAVSPKPIQLLSLQDLLRLLITFLPNVTLDSLFGHADFGKPACPGYEVMAALKQLKEGKIF